ncbi:hypothetical protein STAFG_0726 [Streptomyces afghaniensis 772]|uniref:DNA ligase (ATP) n=1 Tax=Streptomyces afghaniensis 772 TaxID=1283301 RepID=S4NUP2_9ACTN|nr:hypothetical protein STAFG_0726 [Streptomyces afghaniensis 772]
MNGFGRRTLLDLRERLDGLRESGSPFEGPVREAGARWVRPELVARIAFAEWTRDGMLRHPAVPGAAGRQEAMGRGVGTPVGACCRVSGPVRTAA